MQLKLMAPFRSHFCLNTGILSIVTDEYIEFWSGVANSFKNKDAAYLQYFEHIDFMHSRSHWKQNTISYSNITEDTTEYSLHLLEIAPAGIKQMIEDSKQAVLSEVSKETGSNEKKSKMTVMDEIFQPAPDSALIRVYDHTISIIQIDVVLSRLAEHLKKINYDLFLDTLQEVAIAFGQEFTKRYYRKALHPLLEELSLSYDPDAEYIKKIGAYKSYFDMVYKTGSGWKQFWNRENNLFPVADKPEAKVLWVTRMLCFESQDKPRVNSFTEYWLKDTGDKAEIHRVKGDSRAYSLSWVNYLLREDAYDDRNSRVEDRADNLDNISFEDAWDGMLMCQYYYSALDCLNADLQYVIGLSYSDEANKKIRELNRHLKNTVANANLLILNYHDIQKYLKRDKLSVFQQIMKKWDYDHLISHVKDKMSWCAERLDDLHKVSTERSSLYTDILLLVIGAVSIIDLLLTLSEYGRTLTADAVLGFRDEGPVNILSIISRISTDVILYTGGSLIILISILYYFFRRKRLL